MKSSHSIKSITLLIFMALATSVVFNSCKDDDPCDGVTCENGGTCSDGDCACPITYEGLNCETETRAKFISSYTAVPGSCLPGTSYTLSITESSIDVAKFIMNDLGDVAGLNVTGRVTGGGGFTIDSQTLTDTDNDTWTISGTGTLSGNTITTTISYNLIGVGAFTCTETWNKQ